LAFEHREMIADTEMRPAPERQISIARTSLTQLFRKTRRIKLLWLFPKARVTVHRVGAYDDGGVGWNPEPAYFIVSDRFARNEPHRRIEPQRFLKDHARVLQFGSILGCG